jgi:hypothetical protein
MGFENVAKAAGIEHSHGGEVHNEGHGHEHGHGHNHSDRSHDHNNK